MVKHREKERLKMREKRKTQDKSTIKKSTHKLDTERKQVRVKELTKTTTRGAARSRDNMCR